MKLALLLPAALPFHGIADALIVSAWTMEKIPSTRVSDITFPITIEQADHIPGYYFGQNFNFGNSSSSPSGYGRVGLQPQANNDGTLLTAVFSSFVPGTTTSDWQFCTRPRSKGQPVVSCSLTWHGDYNRPYFIEIKNTPANSTSWEGTLIDGASGERMHIGTYVLPAGSGGVQDTQRGFVEWMPWVSGGKEKEMKQPACAKLPYQRSVLGYPFSSFAGSAGTVNWAESDESCGRVVKYATREVQMGLETQCRFPGQMGT